MKLSWSSMVEFSLAGHSWVGLLAGALMYLVCLSGALVVFFPELERWEQPRVEEYLEYEPLLVEKGVQRVLDLVPRSVENLYVELPSPAAPRLQVATDAGGWFVRSDGTLGEVVAHPWTELLLDLHVYLHLPATAGLLVVGALGALLLGLIVSGFLAHPRIFKDAFSLRVRGSEHLEQADIHNRLSVWGAPFHLAIAATGAYFGLVTFLLPIVAGAFYGGDERAARAPVFGEEPNLEEEPGPLAIAEALGKFRRVAPSGALPIRMMLHDVGRPGRFIEIFATHPGRLIYSENYRFDARGRYVGKAGFSDGDIGKQVVYSTYRIHFGHFGGFPVKLAYGTLGLALTVVSVTGVNIWLARRRSRDPLNDLWAGVVWGSPPALALTGVTQVLFDLPSAALFWGALSASAALALRVRDEARATRYLQAACAFLLAVLLVGYGFKFGESSLRPAALFVNLAFAGTAAVMAALSWRGASPGVSPENTRPPAGSSVGRLDPEDAEAVAARGDSRVGGGDVRVG